MKKFVLIGIIIALLRPGNIFSQPLDERIQFEFGGHLGITEFTIDINNVPIGSTDTRDRILLTGGTIGINYTSFNHDDFFAINTNFSPCVGFNTPYDDFRFYYILPVQVMARIGAASTPLNENRFGAGIGFGIVYWKYDISDYPTQSGNVKDYGVDHGTAPLASIEITFEQWGQLTTVRLETTIQGSKFGSRFIGLSSVTNFTF